MTPPPRGAAADLRDAWADLVHGSCCVVCGRAGRALCGACGAALPGEGVPVVPDPCPAGLAPCRAAGEYDVPLRPVLLAHKEHGAWALARPLGAVLAGVLADLATGRPLVLVPVPSRGATVRQRGHDPLLRVVRIAAAHLRAVGLPASVVPALRLRLSVADQAGLSSADRAANLADAMAVTAPGRRLLERTPQGALGRGVVICDDVLTTGATAREAQRALEETGVPVQAIGCIAATRRRTVAPGAGRLPVSGRDD